MNKDEAEKWKDIAKKAIANHDYEKAIRFLEKSNKLFPSPEADGLINLCQMNLKNRGSGNTTASGNGSTTDGPYKRATTTKPSSEEPERPKNFTPEDVKLCNDILKKTNYYDILGIEK